MKTVESSYSKYQKASVHKMGLNKKKGVISNSQGASAMVSNKIENQGVQERGIKALQGAYEELANMSRGGGFGGQRAVNLEVNRRRQERAPTRKRDEKSYRQQKIAQLLQEWDRGIEDKVGVSPAKEKGGAEVKWRMQSKEGQVRGESVSITSELSEEEQELGFKLNKLERRAKMVGGLFVIMIFFAVFGLFYSGYQGVFNKGAEEAVAQPAPTTEVTQESTPPSISKSVKFVTNYEILGISP